MSLLRKRLKVINAICICLLLTAASVGTVNAGLVGTYSVTSAATRANSNHAAVRSTTDDTAWPGAILAFAASATVGAAFIIGVVDGYRAVSTETVQIDKLNAYRPTDFSEFDN